MIINLYAGSILNNCRERGESMHSFHQSRGRIFFEVLCAFGISASCALAWVQTYAAALLGAAGIAALYGIVHFFDMFRRAPVAVAEAVEPAVRRDRNEDEARVDGLQLEAEAVPAAVAVAVRKPRKKRLAKAAPTVVETPAAQPDPVALAPVEPGPVELAVVEPDAEPEYAPIAPLFEPEPFVRQQQRAAFGRKFGMR
jgi:hypothetical protein